MVRGKQKETLSCPHDPEIPKYHVHLSAGEATGAFFFFFFFFFSGFLLAAFSLKNHPPKKKQLKTDPSPSSSSTRSRTGVVFVYVCCWGG